jgi:K+-transporting ATPase KdpF subunit
MKKIEGTKSLIILVVTPVSAISSSNGNQSYLIGCVIAILIMAYLIYSLIKPEKF